MDSRTEKATETTLTHELMQNARQISHPEYGTLILHRPTPRMEYEIGELRRKQYHKDLNDESILSRSELERKAIQRGIWSKADAERSQYLQARIGQIMGQLDSVGYETVEVVLTRYQETVNTLVFSFTDVEGGEKAVEAIHRYFNLDNPTPAQLDHQIIFDSAPNSDVEELLEKGKIYRIQIQLLEENQLAIKELEPLLQEQARLFEDSIESRADSVEKWAKLYHCVKRPDGTAPWKSYDALLDEPPRSLQILMEEMYFFERGIPDRDRTILSRHGFTMRAPTEASSENSLGTPQPNSNGESQPNEPISSGVVADSSTPVLTVPSVSSSIG